MSSKNNIKKRLYILIAILLAVCYSCKEKLFILDIDCDECYSEKPEYGELIVYFSPEQIEKGIPYVLYEGNVDENKIALIDTSYDSKIFIGVESEKYYSIKALYYTNTGKPYYVVNGTKILLKRVSSECDVLCWIYEGQEIKLYVEYPEFLEK